MKETPEEYLHRHAIIDGETLVVSIPVALAAIEKFTQRALLCSCGLNYCAPQYLLCQECLSKD